MAETKPSFGEQAARFSLYAPLMVLLIGLLTLRNRESPAVAMAIVCINVLLIVAGLVLGIIALLLVRRFGRQGILTRSILGIVLNGFLLTVAVSTIVPVVLAGRVRTAVVGQWRMNTTSPDSATAADVTFNEDGTFRFAGTSASTPVALAGRWTFSRDRVISVTIEQVEAGDASAKGTTMPLGRVSDVDEQRMTLVTDKGNETYDRIP